MKIVVCAFCFMAGLSFALPVLAAVKVEQGEMAVQLYNNDRNKSQVLSQINKMFVLRTPDGKENKHPTTITVKVGERFYIKNEEKVIVHNVYDTTDASWVLEKQEPSGIAAVTFDKPGKHNLRCAIHPIMKIEVLVVP